MPLRPVTKPYSRPSHLQTHRSDASATQVVDFYRLKKQLGLDLKSCKGYVLHIAPMKGVECGPRGRFTMQSRERGIIVVKEVKRKDPASHYLVLEPDHYKYDRTANTPNETHLTLLDMIRKLNTIESEAEMFTRLKLGKPNGLLKGDWLELESRVLGVARSAAIRRAQRELVLFQNNLEAAYDRERHPPDIKMRSPTPELEPGNGRAARRSPSPPRAVFCAEIVMRTPSPPPVVYQPDVHMRSPSPEPFIPDPRLPMAPPIVFPTSYIILGRWYPGLNPVAPALSFFAAHFRQNPPAVNPAVGANQQIAFNLLPGPGGFAPLPPINFAPAPAPVAAMPQAVPQTVIRQLPRRPYRQIQSIMINEHVLGPLTVAPVIPVNAPPPNLLQWPPAFIRYPVDLAQTYLGAVGYNWHFEYMPDFPQGLQMWRSTHLSRYEKHMYNPETGSSASLPMVEKRTLDGQRYGLRDLYDPRVTQEEEDHMEYAVEGSANKRLRVVQNEEEDDDDDAEWDLPEDNN